MDLGALCKKYSIQGLRKVGNGFGFNHTKKIGNGAYTRKQ